MFDAATFGVAVLSLLVAVVTLALGDKTSQRIRSAVAILFGIVSIVVCLFGSLSFLPIGGSPVTPGLQATSESQPQADVPTSSPPTANPVYSDTPSVSVTPNTDTPAPATPASTETQPGVGSTPLNTLSAQQLRDSAFSSYHQGEYALALEIFGKCKEAYPEYADCYHGLGMTYREIGDFANALTSHDRAVALNPRSYEYLLERGATYMRMSDMALASSDLRKCMELNPGFADCHNALAMSLREQGQLEDAMTEHNVAIGLRSDRADFFWERGITFQRMGDVASADIDFAQARALGIDR